MRNRLPLGIAAVVSWFPPDRDRVQDAVAAGRVDAGAAEAMRYTELPVAAVDSAPEMAVRAARAVLRRAHCAPERVGLLMHAWMHFQGHEVWSPAHYLASELGAVKALPVGVQQACNGAAMALELAADHLAARPDSGYVLVTAADRFPAEGFDRWRGDYGIAYGDSGTAVLLHQPDPAADELLLLSLATAAAPELEGMHRGDDPFAPVSRWYGDQVDIRRTKAAYVRAHGPEKFAHASRTRLAHVIRESLKGAGLGPRDRRLRAVLLPRLGHRHLQETYAEVIGELVGAEILELGRNSGHLGPGDVLANMASLRELRLLESGEVALIVNVGAGYTWSSLAVEACARSPRA
ncbi:MULTISPECIES: ketoacyl-ACP synthase III family protein [Streptomyces]|uniref:Beta-ketoacyl-[acyl-carrier-protein] synthase III N-terminal domain-containing protein n=1 Tax=Streptomyces lasiicapitis TaxID=1923961 RepID=A0ABQ2MS97_9ACTN|nr:MULTISPECIES: ketoacyl-ACP synthase III family protein [Streptomyces]QIB44425.1 3-oxoacyl-ACP synthase [Streptomyces aureoverticillatus]GGO57013.1 hypothetical protein GCM10012286_72840 [Streptomyces lasiicapitis]